MGTRGTTWVASTRARSGSPCADALLGPRRRGLLARAPAGLLPLERAAARVLDGLEDLGVPGAAAEVRGQRGADLVAAGARVLGHELARGHDHPRLAEAA